MTDTSLPIGGPQFRTTAWSVIRDAQEPDAPERALALERLISIYWRPVYWNLRLDWNCNRDEAKDVTQEYFSTFLDKKMIEEVHQDRGRFRAFVKATLKNFMLSRKRAQNTLKRGGGRRIVPMDDLEKVETSASAKSDPPEKRFERELMRSIIQESLRTLEKACADQQKPELFKLFETYYLEESAGRDVKYSDLEQQFQMTSHEVKNRLAELRARFREIMLGFLRDGISSEEELLGEIQEVFEA